eukprot:scaffold158200_cov17-Prasinocladus_malaysianus.AAC.1
MSCPTRVQTPNPRGGVLGKAHRQRKTASFPPMTAEIRDPCVFTPAYALISTEGYRMTALTSAARTRELVRAYRNYRIGRSSSHVGAAKLVRVLVPVLVAPRCPAEMIYARSRR